MITKIAVTFSLLAILALGLFGQALATGGAPGVKVGDYFVYSITTHWNTTNPSLTPPSDLLVYNSTARYNVTVIAVQNTNVSIYNNLVFRNGTVLTAPSESNVDSGELIQYIPNYPAFQGLYDINLGKNSPLYPSGNITSIVINQTLTRSYPFGNRDTNVVSNSLPISDINGGTGTQVTTFYIDKAIGVLVERDDVIQFPEYTASIIWKLQSTNLWAVSLSPLLLPVIIAGVITIVIIAVVVFYYRKRNKVKKKYIYNR